MPFLTQISSQSEEEKSLWEAPATSAMRAAGIAPFPQQGWLPGAAAMGSHGATGALSGITRWRTSSSREGKHVLGIKAARQRIHTLAKFKSTGILLRQRCKSLWECEFHRKADALQAVLSAEF